MQFSTDQIRAIAHLARLKIEDSDIEQYAEKLSSIVSFVQQLESAPTGEVSPMAHPLNVSQRLRDDEVTEIDQHDAYQKNAQHVEAGLYLVPKVIDS
ncbi:MAG: Asp-tRNA(Asn)/Glu-tRNA(Gln) amidotransferase subunit GatC [Gammaproteobacteria bacterium]|nr:Asp-tRNA(Asn)/Glu-tRNA(Gln) amidotransferase subunit GatC [Gammaproteobacteria bacterium]